ncbi:MAG: glycogen/starch/alpha-glucan phosphorylase, partial [Candidatus Izemoplasmatales bacterium]
MNTPFHSKHAFIKTFSERLESTYLKTIESSSVRERFNILGTLVREEIAKSWMNTQKYVDQKQPRQVHYFSMEFLLGRLLTNSLMSLGVRDVVEAAFKDYGIDLTEMESYEADPGLGTGGLGRLAACYLDSMSAIGVFGIGHCIRYRYGLFRQKIKNGYQEERPDNWLSDGSVWEIRREEEAEDIPFNGYVVYDHKMNYVPSEFIRAVPYDIPIIGAGNGV